MGDDGDDGEGDDDYDDAYSTFRLRGDKCMLVIFMFPCKVVLVHLMGFEPSPFGSPNQRSNH